MKQFDVVVIGGGPAGSTCARWLRERECNVLVLDRSPFPRDKTCAGWVTPPVLELLQIDLEGYAETRTLQPITSFRVGVIGRSTVDVDYDAPVSYGIRRCEFDHYLLQRSGAELELGQPLTSCLRSDRQWILNDRIQTPMLVGAGGHFCPVARQLGARKASSASVVTAQEIEFQVSTAEQQAGGVAPHRPELYFCPDLQGYGWCFRKGNYLNVGLGRTDPTDLPQHMHEFCQFLRTSGALRGELPEKVHGHAYQLYEREQPLLVDEGVLLVGDAAGLAYPQSGEGIRPAVESGLMAAEVISEAAGDYSAEQLQRYAERVRARFGPPGQPGMINWLPSRWLHSLAATLLTRPGFVRRRVLEDWFLHLKQPKLHPHSGSSSLTGCQTTRHPA